MINLARHKCNLEQKPILDILEITVNFFKKEVINLDFSGLFGVAIVLICAVAMVKIVKISNNN